MLESAVAALRRRAISVLALKSSHHPWDDRQGSDSQRLAEAGADGAVFLGTNGAQLHLEPPPTLAEILAWLAPRYQLALVEGGKSSPYPKVELLADQPPLLDPADTVALLDRASPDVVERFLRLLDQHAAPFS